MTKVVLLVDYFGKWVDDKISWRWNSQNDTVRTLFITNVGAFSRHKAPPVEIMNNEDVQIYLNDINDEGGRPILRISSIEKSLESGYGLSNHQSEDVLPDRFEKEDVLPCQVERDAPLDNGVDVQLPELLKDATIRSHHSYIFSDGLGFRKGYRFLNKDDAVTKLNLVAIRKGFEFTTKKSNKSLLIVVCVEKSYKWRVRVAKFLNLDAFHITSKSISNRGINKYLEEIRRKGYGNVVKYLENVIGFKRWSRANFPGHRYDVMTTNIAESVNARLVTERELLIIALFNAIQRLFCR
ncbi:hypothetical protein CQW23_07219 [Capsicum baccatum]|uniref:Uncharacterized protein n=1 Tax=Capsicum baccatum TaxID=33114 RepID=A0A2G2X5L0_CAPBA|nr:hypothetical protein CQW23_07219 [Capsicum baccatum]